MLALHVYEKMISIAPGPKVGLKAAIKAFESTSVRWSELKNIKAAAVRHSGRVFSRRLDDTSKVFLSDHQEYFCAKIKSIYPLETDKRICTTLRNRVFNVEKPLTWAPKKKPYLPRINVIIPNAVIPNAVIPNAVIPNAVIPNAVIPNAVIPNAVIPNAVIPNAVIPNAVIPNAIITRRLVY